MYEKIEPCPFCGKEFEVVEVNGMYTFDHNDDCILAPNKSFRRVWDDIARLIEDLNSRADKIDHFDFPTLPPTQWILSDLRPRSQKRVLIIDRWKRVSIGTHMTQGEMKQWTTDTGLYYNTGYGGTYDDIVGWMPIPGDEVEL